MSYLILATCSSAVLAIVLRIFENSKGNRYGIILGNYLVCVLISCLSLPDRSMILRGSLTTVLCGIVGGAFCCRFSDNADKHAAERGDSDICICQDGTGHLVGSQHIRLR